MGLLFLPLGLAITGLRWLLFRATSFAPLVDEAGRRNAVVDILVVGLGLAFTLLGYAVLQAAVARMVIALEAGRPADRRARRLSLGGSPPRSADRRVLILVVVQALLDLSVVLAPVAVYLLVRWSLVGIVIGHEDERAPVRVLRRSGALTAGHWARAAGITLVAAAALLIGPVVGLLALLATGAAFGPVNLIAALVYVVTLPFAALVTNYLYLDLRARPRAAPAEGEPAADPSAA